jgi:hypothetical protein
MEAEKLEYPQWQAPLQDAILEFNLDKLPAKVYRVETLIFERLQQLQTANNDARERQAINDALEILRAVKRERLQFPDWE